MSHHTLAARSRLICAAIQATSAHAATLAKKQTPCPPPKVSGGRVCGAGYPVRWALRCISAGQKQLDSRTVIDSDDAIYTRRKLDLEEGGILRVTGYGLSCEFTLSTEAV